LREIKKFGIKKAKGRPFAFRVFFLHDPAKPGTAHLQEKPVLQDSAT